jgi:hypothetical protein
MKKADPACRVMGGIGGGPDTFTREIMEAGCLEHLDVLNIHTYPGMMSPEGFFAGMDKLLALMDGHGGRKPIWITEFSYYAVDDLPRRPFVPDGKSWAEERLLESEKQCAEYMVRFLAVMLSRGVEKVFLHSGASGSVNDPSPECCLFGYGGVPRKVFPAVAVLTDLLGPSPRFAGERRLGKDVYCQAFETGTRALLVMWASAGELTVRVPAAAGVKVVDIMGRPLRPGEIVLGETPVYLVGPPGSAGTLTASLQ